jgi:hypothetical protein
VLLVALLGGSAMGAIAGARRTQSSFPTLTARSNSSNLLGRTAVANPALGETNGYHPKLVGAISRLRYVKDVKSLVEMTSPRSEVRSHDGPTWRFAPVGHVRVILDHDPQGSVSNFSIHHSRG